MQRLYAGRGVNLVRVARRWTFRTAEDLSWLLAREDEDKRKLSRAAIETLAIVAYHQPVTRADIEEIRGVAVSKGALDVLMEAGWVRMRGRRKAPGRPITYGTTTEFLIQFGLDAISDLPGLDELQAAGLFDGKLPAGYGVPQPSDEPALRAGRGAARDGGCARRGLGTGRARRDGLTRGRDRVTKPPETREDLRSQVPWRRSWLSRLLAGAAIGLVVLAVALAAQAAPLASHRAAYDISLDRSGPRRTRRRSQTPVAASGLIAYEFRGSACDGYTSSFRQMTEMERSEGDPLAMDVNATSFEAADGASMRFKIDTKGVQDAPPVAGHRDARRGRRPQGGVDRSPTPRRSTSAATSCFRPSTSSG